MNKTFKQIKKEIKKANSIGLFCHRNPDMDCIGSMFALGKALEAMGKKVTMFCAEKFTVDLSLLADEKDVVRNKLDANDFDLFISVDVAAKHMLEQFEDYFLSFPLTIKIDHHHVHGDDNFALINYVNSERSSCCEIILELLLCLGVKVTPEIATYLYAGLSSDTYSFINSNTNINSFKNALKLIEFGADTLKVNNAEYRATSMKVINLKKLFYEKLRIFKEGFAVCFISQADLKACKASKADCSSFSSELLNIEGVNMSCNIVEKEKGIFSLSFRSMTGYNVYEIAIGFNGGGHICSSGGTIIGGTGEEAFEKVVKAMRDRFKKRNK